MIDTPLSAAISSTVSAAVIARGEPIYVGTVYPRTGHPTTPTYVYERRVEDRGDVRTSTHVTRDLAGRIQLAESATSSPDYVLADYTLHTNQLGQSGTIRIEDDAVTFHLVDGGRVRSRVEHTIGPVVVGPTLVGYIIRHLAALRTTTLGVRLAILDRLETIGFELELVDTRDGETRVRMRPSSVWVRLVVGPVDFTFATATATLVRLEGPVPPRVRAGNRWKNFTARVEYRQLAAGYR